MTDRRLARKTAISWIHRLDPSVRVVLSGNDATDVSLRNPAVYSWDGVGNLVATGVGLSSGLHEVCHFLLCAPERRKLPEYGLGRDPYREVRVWTSPPVVVSSKEAIREEIYTCQLQLAAMCLLGFSEELVLSEGRNLGDTEIPTEIELRAIQKYRPNVLSKPTWRALFKSLLPYDQTLLGAERL
jgi:hypothetical protein